MRAGIYRCFVCGKIETVTSDTPPSQPLPGPPTWKMATVWMQNQETSITLRIDIPLCFDPCQAVPAEFHSLLIGALHFVIAGTVLQSAPCRPKPPSPLVH